MHKVPAEHVEFLKRRPFQFRCSTEIFPPEELKELEEYGNWLEALAAGKIQPVTPDQHHFLQVDRDEAPITTLCERAWVRLKGRREYEAEQQMTPAHEPLEDYGMVEWDADRCWW